MKTAWYPLTLTPIYKDYIWGGDRLARTYGRENVPDVCAESWEVADRPEGMSVVSTGPLAGTPLGTLVATDRTALVGHAAPNGPFPLLIKIIDAKQTLSVQVHPNEESAARHGGEAKTEMWYILDAPPESAVYAGQTKGANERTLRDAIAANALEEQLVRSPVQAGDSIYIEGGCLHAIGAGCLLLEVQQNSNTTYRVYDWGRVGHDGRPRELHIEQALRVTNWTQPPPRPTRPVPSSEHVADVVHSPYFQITHRKISAPATSRRDGRSFEIVFCQHGHGRVVSAHGSAEMKPGASALLPAALAECTIVPDEPMVVLVISL